MRKLPIASLWMGIAILCLLGIVSAVERARDVAGTMAAGGPVPGEISPLNRRIGDQVSAALGAAPGTERYRELEHVVLESSSKYAANPRATLIHMIGGALLFVLAPLQFSRAIRTRWTRFHRWSGRLLVVTAVAAGLSGIYFGIFAPHDPVMEPPAIVLFGGVMVFAALRAFAAIRARDVVRHREWMIRMFAAALAISVIRIGHVLVLAVAGSPALLDPAFFGASLWAGWLATLGAAEWWIRRTRPAGRTAQETLIPTLLEEHRVQ